MANIPRFGVSAKYRGKGELKIIILIFHLVDAEETNTTKSGSRYFSGSSTNSHTGSSRAEDVSRSDSVYSSVRYSSLVSLLSLTFCLCNKRKPYMCK